MPKVTVIIPIYNQEKYLEECLQSVANQTFDDFEAILINDGSSDNSEKIALSFSQKYPFIKYFKQENQGVSVARNKGIDQAQGQYLYFLDSDDTISPNFLEESYDKAKNEHADFVVCGQADWTDGLESPPCVWTGSVFVEKELVNKHQIRFPEKIQPCEDGIFSTFCFAVAKKVVYLPQAGYFHRDYETSHSQVVKKQSDVIYRQLPEWLEIIEAFYEKNNLWDKKYLHLAMFFQKEPFARFINYPFDIKQEIFLYDKLNIFYKSHLESRIKEKDFDYFNKDFKIFIKSKNFFEYFIKSRFALKNLFSIKNEYFGNKKIKYLTILGIKLKIS